ncbi:hypothetical protein [Faecalicoccus pleomorphus]|uniref:Uncharacterized protein n=1 Tax=Faecalicoccus pleomorphus TaxID=1323 RepID=A0A7X9RK74_9FIRM|nr:hypothetical protein [Faecalicoccus pleomorphus]MBM6765641.1 hypothetical protein [Faecalicoccus pleomorphus]MBM6807687.1 hypothetical protein [Faecalicoccus pleomorphus]MDB7987243.1 hypothetical protein [Faecalicoccus pleomorphus]MDB7991099.1 hypothetical protein [Faecalicoccus pleomorphus]MDM8291942.1 hypothetical protein [Faecalicoccus pleomorphus]
MQDWSMRMILVFVILALLYIIFSSMYRKVHQERLLKELQSLDFEAFDKDIRSTFTKLFFPLYMVEFMKLNRYIMADDTAMIKEQFQKLIRIARNKKQRYEIISMAFEHYVYEEDKEQSKNLLDTIDQGENQGLKDHAHMLYDILIDHKSNHISIMEEQFPQCTAQEKAIVGYLLAKQYRSLNNIKKAEYYEKFVKKESA